MARHIKIKCQNETAEVLTLYGIPTWGPEQTPVSPPKVEFRPVKQDKDHSGQFRWSILFGPVIHYPKMHFDMQPKEQLS